MTRNTEQAISLKLTSDISRGEFRRGFRNSCRQNSTPPTAESVRERLGPRGPKLIAHAGRIKERVRNLLLEVFVAGKNRAQEMWREHSKGTFWVGFYFRKNTPGGSRTVGLYFIIFFLSHSSLEVKYQYILIG